MAQNPPQRNSPPGNLSEQAVRDFIDLQREELKLRQQEAIRILEIVATAIISGGGGYAWGKSRTKREDKSKVEIVE